MERQRKVKERWWKGGGKAKERSRKGSGKAVERQWKGSGKVKEGSRKGQGKAATWRVAGRVGQVVAGRSVWTCVRIAALRDQRDDPTLTSLPTSHLFGRPGSLCGSGTAGKGTGLWQDRQQHRKERQGSHHTGSRWAFRRRVSGVESLFAKGPAGWTGGVLEREKALLWSPRDAARPSLRPCQHRNERQCFGARKAVFWSSRKRCPPFPCGLTFARAGRSASAERRKGKALFQGTTKAACPWLVRTCGQIGGHPAERDVKHLPQCHSLKLCGHTDLPTRTA